MLTVFSAGNYCVAQSLRTPARASAFIAEPAPHEKIKLPDNLAALLSASDKMPEATRRNLESQADHFRNAVRAKHLQSVNNFITFDSAVYDSTPGGPQPGRPAWGRSEGAAYTRSQSGQVMQYRRYSTEAPSPILHPYYSTDYEYNALGLVTVRTVWYTRLGVPRLQSIDSITYDSHNNISHGVSKYYYNDTLGYSFITDYENIYNSAGYLIKTTYTSRSPQSAGSYSSTVAFPELGPAGEVHKKVESYAVNDTAAGDTNISITPTYYAWAGNESDPGTKPDSVIYFRGTNGAQNEYILTKYTYGPNNYRQQTNFYFYNDTLYIGGGETFEYDTHGNLSLNQFDSVSFTGDRTMRFKYDFVNQYTPEGALYRTIQVLTGNFNFTHLNDSIGRITYFGFREFAAVSPLMAEGRVATSYPNPFNTSLTISLPAGFNADTYTITDLSGRLMKQGTISAADSKANFETGGLSAGIYLLRLSRDGRSLQTLKICKTE
ncbi:MAG: T9SS type A sorting domain-containing protein [Bacteroidota bacterium]